MWRLGLGRNEEELLGWDWGNQNYSEAGRQGRWTRQHVDRLVCWITQAPLDEDSMQAVVRLLREEADAELEEADEDMRPENNGINQQQKYTTQRCYFNALQVTFRYRNGTAHKPAQDPYYKKSNAWIAWLNWVIFAAEGRQDRDQKELLFGKTHKELLEIVSALGKEVEKLQGWQNPPMTRQKAFTVNSVTKRDGWDTLFEWLALASMVLQPPVRGNWGKMQCTTDWELATRLLTLDSTKTSFTKNQRMMGKSSSAAGLMETNRADTSCASTWIRSAGRQAQTRLCAAKSSRMHLPPPPECGLGLMPFPSRLFRALGLSTQPFLSESGRCQGFCPRSETLSWELGTMGSQCTKACSC